MAIIVPARPISVGQLLVTATSSEEFRNGQSDHGKISADIGVGTGGGA